ncbi:hypothetical protein HMPREF9212_0545 [Lactobacillus iners LactinV 03V1-b]|nr:hypothetical protein HMPREF9212_0545 [Lactobacillus iners LactinV 03V1-b]
MIGGFKGWLLFGIIYTLAVIGILFCIFNKGKRPLGEIILYIAMGWTALTFGNTIFPLLGKKWIFTSIVRRSCLYYRCFIVHNEKNSIYSCHMALIRHIRFGINIFFNPIICLI